MGKPAARMGDMHVCPMAIPDTPPIPHVGGPIIAASAPTVMICSMPAAVMGDMCTCVGPPDTILMGSTGVFICGKPAAPGRSHITWRFDCSWCAHRFDWRNGCASSSGHVWWNRRFVETYDGLTCGRNEAAESFYSGS